MTSISAISDAYSQVAAIEDQLQQLSSGTLLESALGVSSTSTASSSDSTTSSSDSTDANEFAQALAAAEGTDSSDSATTGTDDTSGVSDLLTGAATGTNTSASAANVTLPTAASSLLTSDQQAFAQELSAKTGLSPAVVCAWVLAEESGSAATSRQSANNNDWLNVGYTDSATYGASDSIWSNPTTAADATASWLKGQDSIPGYGTASSGVQSILDSVGQPTSTQISALQNSGWASSGYPDLTSTYNEITGG